MEIPAQGREDKINIGRGDNKYRRVDNKYHLGRLNYAHVITESAHYPVIPESAQRLSGIS